MRNKRMNMILGAIFCLFFITACGGGGSSSNTPITPNIYLAQSTIDFAGIVLNNNADRSFYIKNTGNANLNIGQISPPGLPFSISSDTCSNKTLTPSQTCSLIARFSPTSQDSFAGTFSIPSNDPDSTTVNITLSGVGYGLNVWINQVNSASCPNISVDVTVTDPSNPGPLGFLTMDNFILKQNGLQQVITAVSPIENPSPVSLVLALDWSGSETAVLPDIKTATKYFVDQLRDTDEAAICKFREVVEFFPKTPPPFFYTTDSSGKNSLKGYIDSSFDVPDGTSLYDAVFQSIDRAAEGNTGKFAVIVLSDGADNPQHTGGKTLEEVIAHAIEKRIPVFTIFYVDPAYYYQAKTEIMQRLAKDTGGQYYNPDNTTLTTIFEQISNVLSNKYTISYSSSTCTGTISLDVRADWAGLYGLDSRTIVLP